MNIEEQYELIEPDTITKALAKRGWTRQAADLEVLAGDPVDIWAHPTESKFIMIADGEQFEAMTEVMVHEGPLCVAEIWLASLYNDKAHKEAAREYRGLADDLLCHDGHLPTHELLDVHCLVTDMLRIVEEG